MKTPRIRTFVHVAAVSATLLMLLAGCVPGRSPGEKLWRRQCASCHGIDGGGGGLYLVDEGADLLDETWKSCGRDPSELEYCLLDEDVPKHKRWDFTREERKQLVDHMLYLRGERR